MRILLANDDGIMAPGLHILGRALSEIAEIYVAAPQQERSGASHGITVKQPLYAEETELPFAQRAWAISGLPADCVKVALEELLPQTPDLVVSGVNNGGNVGNDILYSGTVAAAMEGFLYGLPAIAVSALKRDTNIQEAAEFVRSLCLKWQAKAFQPHTLLNINVPGCAPQEIRGHLYTSMGWRWYEDVFEQKQDEQGQNYFWMGGRVIEKISTNNTDVEACLNGYISISPLNFDLTNYEILGQLGKENI